MRNYGIDFLKFLTWLDKNGTGLYWRWYGFAAPWILLPTLYFFFDRAIIISFGFKFLRLDIEFIFWKVHPSEIWSQGEIQEYPKGEEPCCEAQVYGNGHS